MAALDATNRLRVAYAWMRDNAEPCAFNKTALNAAVNATDQWIEDNQAAFNAALPTAFRNNSSLTQKTILFCFVAMRRAGRLKVAED